MTIASGPFPEKGKRALQRIGKHATRHFHETGHPIMRSVMPGAAWTWCYVHELEGRLDQAVKAQE